MSKFEELKNQVMTEEQAAMESLVKDLIRQSKKMIDKKKQTLMEVQSQIKLIDDMEAGLKLALDKGDIKSPVDVANYVAGFHPDVQSLLGGPDLPVEAITRRRGISFEIDNVDDSNGALD